MKSLSFVSFGLALLAAASTSYAAASLTLDPSTCADPTGFNTCMTNVNSNAASCITKNCQSGVCTGPSNCGSGDSNCYPSCVCVAYAQWINCAVAHCWNRAYSCEYQSLVVQANEQCGYLLSLAFPPFYPAPQTGPGACSCNLGVAYGVARVAESNVTVCRNKYTSASGYKDCGCCGASIALSSWPEFCPDTDLSSVPGFVDEQALKTASMGFQSCTAISPASCTSMGFSNPTANWKWYGPGQVPVGGSNPLSNTAGNAPLPSRSTIVWSFFKGYTLTAVPVTSNAAVSPITSSAAAGGSSSGVSSVAGSTVTSSGASGAGSSSTASAASTSKSGAAVQLAPVQVNGALAAGVIIAALAL